MDVSATTKYVRLSPTKGRDIVRRLRGKSVSEALMLISCSPRKAAKLVQKTLKSAIANAEHNADLEVNSLVVKTAVIDEGPVLRRFWPRARGSASPILKRTCHIKIVLTDGQDTKAEK